MVASAAIPFLPDQGGRTVRWYALTVAVLDFLAIVYAFITGYDTSLPGMQLVESYTWVPQIDLKWSVAVDGFFMPLGLI